MIKPYNLRESAEETARKRKEASAPLFTQRHYEVIAKLMGETLDAYAFTQDLVEYFAKDNPRFNKQRFAAAVVAANSKKYIEKYPEE